MVVDMDANSECDSRKWNTHTINKQTESAHNATLFFLLILSCGILPIRIYDAGLTALSWRKL